MMQAWINSVSGGRPKVTAYLLVLLLLLTLPSPLTWTEGFNRMKEVEAITYLNKLRTNLELPPVDFSPSLRSTAEAVATLMGHTGIVSHDIISDHQVYQLFNTYIEIHDETNFYNWHDWQIHENLAMVPGEISGYEAVSSFFSSPTHVRQFYSPGIEYVGFGILEHEGYTYIVFHAASRLGE